MNQEKERSDGAGPRDVIAIINDTLGISALATAMTRSRKLNRFERRSYQAFRAGNYRALTQTRPRPIARIAIAFGEDEAQLSGRIW